MNIRNMVYAICHAMVLFFFASGNVSALELRSSDIGEGRVVPLEFTGMGADISPELSWDDVPAGTESFAIIVNDPDAPLGTWTHWVVYDIPPDVRLMKRDGPGPVGPEGAPVLGVNSWGRAGYGGPMPPKGSEHRYVFTVYALDKKLSEPGMSERELLNAMDGHILASAAITARFGR
ncbi:MAG: YbhB/YbcL family Raf kinase inhibitor-like protein [Candidatus Omnitrophica bacterium]|nr:YbhB/YbcL family Raf kinase inhibitor-like protein [Candidatus Omnitrophota bacterium]MDD5488888.1 YbhB/YbcL family Raf kinase inhibitor-like protein [Candidatus Omnitrophota bacterium]